MFSHHVLNLLRLIYENENNGFYFAGYKNLLRAVEYSGKAGIIGKTYILINISKFYV